MRKEKKIKIGEKEITVYEMKIREIIELFDGLDEDEGIATQIEAILPRITDARTEDLLDMTPSEAKEIYDAVREINAVFFEVARGMGMEAIGLQIKDAILQDFKQAFASSSKQDT